MYNQLLWPQFLSASLISHWCLILLSPDVLWVTNPSPFFIFIIFFRFSGSEYTYAFTPCTLLTNSKCTGSSICQSDINNPSENYNIAIFSPQATWGFIDPSSPATGISLNMLGTQNCWNGQGSTYYNSTVYFKCSQHPSDVMQVSNNICNFEFVIPTELACPP